MLDSSCYTDSVKVLKKSEKLTMTIMWDFQDHVIDDANDMGNVDNICIGCCCDVDFVDVQ